MATPWMPQEQADLDYQSIDRRRQMANMLMQDSMGPIQNMGQGPYASLISPFQGVQKMLAAYLGGRGMNRADKDQKDVLMDRNIRLAQALDAVGKGPQRNAPGGITAPQDPGAIVQQPRQEFQDGPIVKPYTAPDPQGRPDMPNDLATALRTPGAIEPNVPTFGPAAGDMPQDIVPPVGITAQKERPETAAEFAARVRIAASTRGINPMALFQSPEVAGKYQQMLEMEKEGRTFQRDIDKLNVQDELAKGLKKYERGLSENDLGSYITDPSGRVIGFNRAGQPTTAATVPQDPTKLVQIGPDGKPVINQVALDAQERVAKARSNKQVTNVSVGGKDFKVEMDLRKEFRDAPIAKSYNEAKIALDQVKRALASKSAIGDVAASTKIMKLLDPPSVVRESELWVAMNSAGVLDRFTNLVNYWASGQRLTDQQRMEFGQLGEQLFKAYEGAYKGHEAEYRQIAKEWGIDERRIVGSGGPQGAKTGAGWKIEEVK